MHGAEVMADQLDSREADDVDDLVIEPENHDPVRLFQALQTQWLVHVASGLAAPVVFRTGLRYEALPIVSAALSITLSESVFNAVRTLEFFALEFFSERRR